MRTSLLHALDTANQNTIIVSTKNSKERTYNTE